MCVCDAGLEVVYSKANSLQLSRKGVSKGKFEEQVFRNLKGKDMFVKGLCERERRNLFAESLKLSIISLNISAQSFISSSVCSMYLMSSRSAYR